MDYYELLGVERSASGDEVKKAFKKKAMKYHPDRTGGDKASEDKFKEAKEAYDVLSDPQKKSMYDQYGTTDFSGGGGQNEDLIPQVLATYSRIFLEMFLVAVNLGTQHRDIKVLT